MALMEKSSNQRKNKSVVVCTYDPTIDIHLESMLMVNPGVFIKSSQQPLPLLVLEVRHSFIDLFASIFPSLSEDDLASKNDQTAEEKFVEHVKELGADTKDVFLNTAANVQHALETAGDYIRTQLATDSSNSTEKTTTTTNDKDQSNLLQQASALKDVLVQKVIEVKDATVDVIKDLATPQEQPVSVADFHHGKATLTADKKNE